MTKSTANNCNAFASLWNGGSDGCFSSRNNNIMPRDRRVVSSNYKAYHSRMLVGTDYRKRTMQISHKTLQIDKLCIRPCKQHKSDLWDESIQRRFLDSYRAMKSIVMSFRHVQNPIKRRKKKKCCCKEPLLPISSSVLISRFL